MQFLRKVFFYTAVCLYPILCPLLILYAFGYIFKPAQEKVFVETGLIYLSSAPSGASVYVNNALIKNKTPTTVQNLLPKDYQVKLELDGYKSWTHTVPVEATKATVLDKILLTPERWQTQEISPTAFTDIVPVPGCQFFLLVEGPAIGDYLVYNRQSGEISQLIDDEFPYRGANVLTHFTVKDSSAILFQIDTQDEERFIWAEQQGGKMNIADITDLFTAYPRDVEWDPSDTRHLFPYQEDYVDQIDIEEKSVYPKYLEDVRGYGISEKKIYVLKGDSTLERMNYDKGSSEVLLDNPVLGRSIFGESGSYKIKAFSEESIVFLGDKGQLLSNRLPYRFVEGGVRGMQYYSETESVLVWQRDRIGILDFKAEQTQNVPFEKGPDMRWVYTEGKDISQGFWVYDGSHVLFRDNGDMFLLEPEPYGEPHVTPISKAYKGSSIYYSDDTGQLYYLDAGTGRLSSVEIVPKHKVISNPFPETASQ